MLRFCVEGTARKILSTLLVTICLAWVLGYKQQPQLEAPLGACKDVLEDFAGAIVESGSRLVRLGSGILPKERDSS